MSCRVDTSKLIAGACVVGDRGLGVLGSVIRATTATGEFGAGYLYNDWQSGDDGKEFRGLIVTPPASGSFFAYEDGSFSLTGVTDGVHSFTYRLFVDGVDLGTATATFTVDTPVADTELPVLSGALTIGAVTTTSISVTWAAGTDNVGITGHEYSINGGTNYFNTGSAAASYTFTGLTAGTSYALRIRAKDAAGNVSTPALAAAQSTASGADVTPPVLSGVIAVTNLTTTGYTLTCPLATDDVGVAEYQYRVNAGSWVAIGGASRAVAVVGRAPSTTDAVDMRAADAAGNVSAALSTSITLGALPVVVSNTVRNLMLREILRGVT